MKTGLAARLAVTLLLLPVAAFAATSSSTNYTISVGRSVGGGGSATDTAGLSATGAAIGLGVLIPPKGSSSTGYSVTPATLAAMPSGTLRSGDINGDGAVDVIDALLALKASAGLVQLSAPEVTRGDVGPLVNGVPVGDNRIDIEDTVLILRKAVGLGW
ncbi:hypothetical protein FO488_14185 [Geobacter sp. FeAm09]|uniref:dockerin type I repeat-containing protein n=1 Tax=Geobacter sp. FeAm09 TaxID=2597769 RepID=UPI0011F04CAD|nr:dockerin type I repeat-containing protein [Geobacter sp. FeAm09]QEM69196.1 hypothetical protein FO488_14185 [Geobacter sp. FeAm09]